MASQTLTGVEDRFPVGTTVSVYARPPAGAWNGSSTPPGSVVTTGVVGSDGSVTFSGLTETAFYLAYAGGRSVNFRADPPSPLSSGSSVLDIGGNRYTTAVTPQVIYLDPATDSGTRVQAILNRASLGLTAVDIVLLPGTHVWNAQPAVSTSSMYVRLRGAPGAKVLLTAATARGYGAEGGGERLLDMKVTADYQSFANIYIEDLLVDCNNNFGLDNAGHVVFGTQRFQTIQARINVRHVFIRRVNTINVPFDQAGVKQRTNVQIYVHHVDSNEATRTYIEDVHIEDCNFQGGTVGALVGGHVANPVPATTQRQANVYLDEIYIERCQHDTTASFSGAQVFQYGSNFQIGDVAIGGRGVIRDCKGKNSIDVGVEVDGMMDATVQNVEITDARGPSFLTLNYSDLIPNPARQQIVLEKCKALVLNVPEGVQAALTTTNGSPTATVASATGIAAGQIVSATGVPYNTTVLNVVGTTVTLSANATAGATVPANFATWRPRGFMAGLYTGATGATQPLGHLVYNDCEWHRPGKTNLSKGEAVWHDGVYYRSATFNRFKVVCDAMAIATATTQQKLIWVHPSGADATAGRSLVTFNDSFVHVAGTMTGGELRLVGVSGVAHLSGSIGYHVSLTGATSSSVFLMTLADDTGSVVQGGIHLRTELVTQAAGWAYYGLRGDGTGTIKDFTLEGDVTHLPAGSADYDRIASFATDAQAAGVRYRNLRINPFSGVFERWPVAANKTLRDWEENIAVTDTSAARTMTMPKAARCVGRRRTIKDESGGAGTNNITIAPNGTDTIDGAASKVIAANYGAVTLYSNGVGKWFTV